MADLNVTVSVEMHDSTRRILQYGGSQAIVTEQGTRLVFSIPSGSFQEGSVEELWIHTSGTIATAPFDGTLKIGSSLNLTRDGELYMDAVQSEDIQLANFANSINPVHWMCKWPYLNRRIAHVVRPGDQFTLRTIAADLNATPTGIYNVTFRVLVDKYS